MHKMNPSDDRLHEALQNMKALGPQGAPSALGSSLEGEFRRHHARRSRERIRRISVFAACGVALASLFILLRPRVLDKGGIKVSSISGPPAPQAKFAVASTQPELSSVKIRKVHRPAITNNTPNVTPASAHFVVLPTFDPAIPIDHLQMVRLELPGVALHLVGFPVSEEIADRRVLADVLFAQDGTPYALRFVQNSQVKERYQ
jgi:hypothetical protein